MRDAGWEPDQSKHGMSCGIQGSHSLGAGKRGDCTCGRDALVAAAERTAAEIEAEISTRVYHYEDDRAEMFVALARAEAERDAALARAERGDELLGQCGRRVEQLETALREIADDGLVVPSVRSIARAALGGPDA